MTLIYEHQSFPILEMVYEFLFYLLEPLVITFAVFVRFRIDFLYFLPLNIVFFVMGTE